MESGHIVHAYDWDDMVQKVFGSKGVPITIDVGSWLKNIQYPLKFICWKKEY
jgi:hypothetical protein